MPVLGCVASSYRCSTVFAFFRPLYGRLSDIYDHKRNFDAFTGTYGSFTEQLERTRGSQCAVDFTDDPVGVRLVDAVDLGDMKLRPVFAPVYQRQMLGSLDPP